MATTKTTKTTRKPATPTSRRRKAATGSAAKTTRAKTAAPKPAAAARKAATATQASTASPADAATPTGAAVALRKRALISAVTERSGLKRGSAKTAVETVLQVLGEAIADGRVLNLPGLGKVKVVRTKKQAKAHVYVTKVRQPMAQQAPAPEPTPETPPDMAKKDPLAEAAE